MTLLQSPILKIALMAENALQKEVLFNEAMLVLDAAISGNVLGLQNTPAVSPADGDVYIVGTVPTGAWAGQANHITYYYNGWQFFVPPNPYQVYNNGTSSYYNWNGSIWSAGYIGSTASLATLTDVNVTEGSGINGYTLNWDNGTGKWIATAPVAGGSATLHSLTDVSVTEGSGINNYVLYWNNGASKWEAEAIATVATTGAYSDLTGAPNLSLYALLASPTFTGVPAAPTAGGGTNTTQLATTAFVHAALGGGSPTLAACTDVSVTEGAGIDGYALYWNNGASRWEAGGPFAPLASPAFTGTPTAPTAAALDNSTKLATTAYADAAAASSTSGVTATLNVKTPVDLATTANITLSGEQTIDGVLTSSSRVLVKNQSLPKNNGIYTSSSGAWTRATDMNTWAKVVAALTFVDDGTVNIGQMWIDTATKGGSLGTTAINWVLFLDTNLGPVSSVAGRVGDVVLAYTDVSGLATVAHTGAYSDLSGTPSVPTTLAALTGDVTISSPAAGQPLIYSGSVWVNAKRADLPVHSFTSSSSTLAIDCNDGEVQKITLSASASTVTVANWTTSGQLCKLTLIINSTGAFTIGGWPAATIWAGGTAPTITSGSGKKDIIVLMSPDAGTTIYGSVVGQDFR